MLFNSYAFLLVFLPATFGVFHLLRYRGFDRGAFAALTLASLAFYGWWSPRYLLLLVALMAVNFALARCLMRRRERRSVARAVLLLGLSFNLAALAYFKYANFFIDNLYNLFGLDLALGTIVLPLGISFFTFQKIALLVDAYQGKVERLNLLDFALFVAFFPQLIAGPIVHHVEVMPQFRSGRRVGVELIALAATIFAIGLAKKVLLADTLSLYAAPIFDAAGAGKPVALLDAWAGAVAYTLQLYFDFSGYSEMAIGVALLFGIRLPLNFASPYKAVSIIEFWRSWHMTLSRFLRDYLYVPLGGNRKGEGRRYVNLFLTMLLGGLWHGAAWTFVVWGALHGALLAVNHAWRALRGAPRTGGMARAAAQALTFAVIVVSWVVFRADNLHAAGAIFGGMSGLNGLGLHEAQLDLFAAARLIVPLLGLVWLAPNTQELTGYSPTDRPGDAITRRWLRWMPSPPWAVVVGCAFALAFLSLSKISEFLYFQF
jgi:D-alanyl-lipoteichoic acid acyltransferase DltB (MBOAT superfamily)